jgi:hypothetical protein
MLLEFPKTIVDSRRSSEKDCAQEEENRDSGGGQGHNLENHFSTINPTARPR